MKQQLAEAEVEVYEEAEINNEELPVRSESRACSPNVRRNSISSKTVRAEVILSPDPVLQNVPPSNTSLQPTRPPFIPHLQLKHPVTYGPTYKIRNRTGNLYIDT